MRCHQGSSAFAYSLTIDIYLFQLGAIMRCPVTKFITHTTSHICFLVLLAVATFRLSESGVSITSTREFNEAHYAHLSSEEKIESLLKETLRPASTLLTHVQICIVFWILGELSSILTPSQYSAISSTLIEI